MCFCIFFPLDLLLCELSILCRLCLKKQDHRSQAEDRAKAVIEEDYRKLGPIKWGLVYVFISCSRRWMHTLLSQNIWLTFTLRAPFQFCRGSDRFLFCIVCHSAVHKRSQIYPWLVCVFWKRVRKTVTWFNLYFVFWTTALLEIIT